MVLWRLGRLCRSLKLWRFGCGVLFFLCRVVLSAGPPPSFSGVMAPLRVVAGCEAGVPIVLVCVWLACGWLEYSNEVGRVVSLCSSADCIACMWMDCVGKVCTEIFVVVDCVSRAFSACSISACAAGSCAPLSSACFRLLWRLCLSL